MSLRGSVFPQAAKYALIVSILSAVLKVMDQQDWIGLTKFAGQINNAVFSGFTFTLGFVLVFRTNQCYNRFLQGASSACTMRSKMFEAASSLVAFSTMSKKERPEVDIFIHKVVRLFSLVHGTALEVICDAGHKEFPVLDIGGIPEKNLECLKRSRGQLRVDMVYQWIITLVTHAVDTGLVAVPPPILSRVFHELELSRVEFNQILQIINIPAPFPYAQAASVLLGVYSISTPIIMVVWSTHPAVAFIITFVCTVALWSIELIATEIENPFGQDVNDLPVFEFQEDMNASLLMLLDPAAREVMDLDPAANMNVSSLITLSRKFKSFSEVSQNISQDLSSTNDQFFDVDSSVENDDMQHGGAKSLEEKIQEKNERHMAIRVDVPEMEPNSLQAQLTALQGGMLPQQHKPHPVEARCDGNLNTVSCAARMCDANPDIASREDSKHDSEHEVDQWHRIHQVREAYDKALSRV